MLDPATNLTPVSFPASGIESVSVLPNPYEAEFGRFSSGLILIQTKRAGDHWTFRLNDLEPAFRLKRYTVLDIQGIAGLKPNVEFGGPLKKGRVFLEQTAQYHYQATDVASRPESELRTSEWFSSFTRIDAVLSSRHGMTMTGGFVPGTSRHTTLGTFTPPDATADIADRVGHAMVTERSLLGSRRRGGDDRAVSRVSDRRPRSGIDADGTAAGDDARQLFQSAAAGHFRVSMDRNGFGLASRAWRPAPVQGRLRSASQRLRRHQRQRPGVDCALRWHAGQTARVRRSNRPVGAQHGCGGVRAGSSPARQPLVPRIRRPHRPRRHRATHGCRPARRGGAAPERIGDGRPARWIRTVLRAHAVNRGRVPAVRACHRHTLRHGWRDHARSTDCVSARDGGGPADGAKRRLGSGLRSPAEPDVLAAREPARPSGQPPARRRSRAHRAKAASGG